MSLYTSFPYNEYHLVKGDIERAIQKVLKSGVYVLGETVGQFEAEFANYIGVNHCIGVANGTDALFLALKALNIGVGDEVITTPFTAAFTALAIAATGAKPVFVDIEPDTFTINPLLIEKAITKRTKAIMPVHLFGKPANIPAIMKLAKQHKLKVIEDACQAHGAELNGKRVGTFGDVACYSFYPTKNLGGIGDGGAIVTNNKALAEKIRLLRLGGQTKKYYHTILGYNSRLDEIQAAILRVKLQHLDEFISMRQEIARQYDTTLADTNLVLPVHPDNERHVFHLYVVRTNKRDQLQTSLAKHDVITQVHYPWPLHKLPAFNYLPKKSLPVSERAAKTALSLPIYPGLKKIEVQKIVDLIQKSTNS